MAYTEKQAKRYAAKVRSGKKAGLMNDEVATRRDTRKAAAARLKKERAAKAAELKGARATKQINKASARVKSNTRAGIPWSSAKGSMARKAAANRLIDSRSASKTGKTMAQARSRRVAGLNSNARHGLGFTPKGSASRKAVAGAIKGQRTAKQRAASIANLKKGRSSIRRRK